MKLKKAVTLALCAAVVCSVGAVASPVSANAYSAENIHVSTEKSGNFTYEVLSDGNARILGCSSTDETVIFPEKIDGHTVTEIGVREGFTGVMNTPTNTPKNIIIPDTVKFIGRYAFSSLSVESVTLPSGLQEMGEGAFSRCESLKEITVPGSLTTIPQNCFMSCPYLTSLTIEEGVKEIQTNAFSFCRSLTEVTIPYSVKTVYPFAFSYDSGLSKVTVLNPNMEFSTRYDNNKKKYSTPFVFENDPNVTLYGYEGSTSEKYAQDNPYEVKSFASLGQKPVMSGDINSDGQITSQDALTVLRYSTGLEKLTNAQQKLADLNGDGKADSADALKILRISVSLE